jgi:hypothetical protein
MENLLSTMRRVIVPLDPRAGNGKIRPMRSTSIGITMTFLNISVSARTSMARRLANFLTKNLAIEIKHSLANQALAAAFGHNEHSLAAAVKREGGIHLDTDKLIQYQCSVPRCSNLACVEVRLFDIYRHVDSFEVFDQQDNTCPFLCGQHLSKNEQEAVGTRKPRDVTRYPFTNRHGAQGYTTYRSLEVKVDSYREMVDFGEGWTIQDALDDELISSARREGDTFFICIGKLNTEISISLRRADFGIEFTPSHAIKTPSQLDPYRTSRPWNNSPGAALRQAITGLTQYYKDEVRKGTQPEETWLVPY